MGRPRLRRAAFLLLTVAVTAPTRGAEPTWPFLPEPPSLGGGLQLTQGTAGAAAATTAVTAPFAVGQPAMAARPGPTGPLSLASLPYMIGDTGMGSCGSINANGALVAAVEHPTYGCSRLNIAEQNNPVVNDRVYFNYRHFENASSIDVFSFAPTGARASYAIDRYTFGWEQLISDSASVEVRLPINRQLTPEIHIAKNTGQPASVPVDDRNTELGNMGLIFKQRIYQDETLYCSAGVGFNLPTARGVSLRATVNDQAFQVFTPQGVPFGPPFPLNLNLNAFLTNETVNMSPFLGAYWFPTERLFAIGFCQLDVPLNESTLRLSGSSVIGGIPVSQFNLSQRVSQQNLLRLNGGLGGWLFRGAGADGDFSLGGMVELHYNTTVSDAEIVGPVTLTPDTGLGPAQLRVGNVANRVDSLNLALGVPIIYGNTLITNGFIHPLRGGENKGFDWEYHLLVQWNF